MTEFISIFKNQVVFKTILEIWMRLTWMSKIELFFLINVRNDFGRSVGFVNYLDIEHSKIIKTFLKREKNSHKMLLLSELSK